jgi:Protein of unknown function (DUF2934)
MQNLDEAIRERAYHLWVAAGQPDGNPDAYWLDAQRELLLQQMSSMEVSATAKPKKAKAAARPRKTAKRAA